MEYLQSISSSRKAVVSTIESMCIEYWLTAIGVAPITQLPTYIMKIQGKSPNVEAVFPKPQGKLLLKEIIRSLWGPILSFEKFPS